MLMTNALLQYSVVAKLSVGVMGSSYVALLFLLYRFTEFYVDEPKCTSDLSVLIQDYLKNELPSTSLVEGIVRCSSV